MTMNSVFSKARRTLLVSALGLAVSACAAHGTPTDAPYSPPLARGGIVQVEVFDRHAAATLPVYPSAGRRYIVGTPGHEYAVRIRNTTGARVLVVTSVDGVNVVSGDTAAPSQAGYVLDPWGSVEIIGWRKSLERTAAFFFTEHQNSYAARTGRPNDVGVIGVAAFREKSQPIARYVPEPRAQASADAEAPSAATSTPSSVGRAEALARRDSGPAAPRPSAKLGTGHGRDEASRVTLVKFERESTVPAQTITLQYDRRENLVAMGVLPGPHYSQREPNPFPGAVRFAPDPPR
jgi:hypothetical protein